MAFNATVYVLQDDPRTLMKRFTNEEPVNDIRPTDIVDLMNPSFILNYDAKYIGKNYIHVEAPFNRYYFINDMKIDIGKKIVINCSVDVLQTYKDSISESTAYIMRTGREASKAAYLPDENVPVTTASQVQNYQFNKTPFNAIDGESGNYVLTVIGGGD